MIKSVCALLVYGEDLLSSYRVYTCGRFIVLPASYVPFSTTNPHSAITGTERNAQTFQLVESAQTWNCIVRTPPSVTLRDHRSKLSQHEVRTNTFFVTASVLEFVWRRNVPLGSVWGGRTYCLAASGGEKNLHSNIIQQRYNVDWVFALFFFSIWYVLFPNLENTRSIPL